MLKTNLENQIRLTPLPKWKTLLPLFEAVMNAFQAVQDAGALKTHKIRIVCRRASTLFDPDAAPFEEFSISDTGIGFSDENLDSFNTAYSDHKLHRGGKGLGRMVWLKAFEGVDIDSVFFAGDEEGKLKRSIVFDVSYDPDKVPLPIPTTDPVGTTVRLKGLREPYRSECPSDIEVIAHRLVEHFVLLLLQPACPAIEITDETNVVSINNLFRTGFQASSQQQVFHLNGHDFTIHSFRLTAPRSSRHKLVYAAHSRSVISENLDEHIPNLSTRLVADDGSTFVYRAIVQSPYLNTRVNNVRTDFDIAPTEDSDGLLGMTQEVGLAEIRNAAIEFVENDLRDSIQSLNEAKAQKIRAYVKEEAPQYKILLRQLDDFIDQISPNASKLDIEMALHKALHQKEIQLKRDGSKIILEAAKTTDYDGYRGRLSDFIERYSEIGASALAQYVMHRKIILDLLDKAISINVQTGKFPLEDAVHNIVFPMKSTSDDTLYSQQNLWIIDERLTYHTFVTSDKPLRSNEEIESSSLKRPDLFIFDRKLLYSEPVDEGAPINSITVIEFKRPQRDDHTVQSNPIDQVFDQVADIRNGAFKDERGRPIPLLNDRIPVYAYIVADITPSLKKILDNRDYSSTPDGKTFYGYHKGYGIYFEVIDYEKLVGDAKRRNRVLFDRLGVASGSS